MMSKIIELSSGQKVIVDDEDYLRVTTNYVWFFRERRNASSYGSYSIEGREKGTKKSLMLHRVILNPEPNVFVYHKNRDILDNRKVNLGVASWTEITRLSRKYTPQKKASKFKGVCRYPGRKYWRVYVQGKAYGGFKDEEQAARMYDMLAMYFYKDFALTNFNDYEEGE